MGYGEVQIPTLPARLRLTVTATLFLPRTLVLTNTTRTETDFNWKQKFHTLNMTLMDWKHTLNMTLMITLTSDQPFVLPCETLTEP